MRQLLAALIVPSIVGLVTYFVVRLLLEQTKMVPSKATPRAGLSGRRSRIRRRPEQGGHVPREGAIIFADLIGKLDVVYVHCIKCGRASRYHLQHLIDDRGRDTKVIDWLDEITADCPKKRAHNWNDPCAVRCPDLPRVL